MVCMFVVPQPPVPPLLQSCVQKTTYLFWLFVYVCFKAYLKLNTLLLQIAIHLITHFYIVQNINLIK